MCQLSVWNLKLFAFAPQWEEKYQSCTGDEGATAEVFAGCGGPRRMGVGVRLGLFSARNNFRKILDYILISRYQCY